MVVFGEFICSARRTLENVISIICIGIEGEGWKRGVTCGEIPRTHDIASHALTAGGGGEQKCMV